MRQAFGSVGPLLLALAGLTGCVDGEGGCVPGMTISCACAGGSGVQSCLPSRTYGLCQCNGPDAGGGSFDVAEVGPAPDATATDASTPDTGASDAGPDVSASDVGAGDTSAVRDASVSDAPLPDAGSFDDGGCSPPALVTTTHNYTGDLSRVSLGGGFNALSQDLSGQCLVIPPPSSTCSGTGSRTFQMQFIRESSRLKESLGLSASASYDGGLWSAEASARFFRSTDVRSDSAYLLLDVAVTFDSQTIPDAQLTDGALARLRSDPEGFVASCGTEYVASVTRGGRFRVVYVFSSLTTREKEELSTSFSAGGGNWMAGGSFERSIERATSRYQTQVYVLQSGGRLEPVGLSPAELIAQARNFGSPGPDGGTGTLNCATAYPISIETRPYYATSNIPIGARYPDVTRQLNELTATANTWDQVRFLRNDLEARLGRPGRLATTACVTDLARFTTKQAEIEAFFREVQAKRDACQSINYCGATSACVRALATPSLSLPRLSDPARCGPACTDGANSTYESDDYGYCTRCTWTWPTTTTGSNTAAGVMRSECRYMRPGAQVLAQARGRLGPPPCSSQTVFYADVNLQTASGVNTDNCTVDTCRIYYRDVRSSSVTANASNQIQVDGRTAPTLVRAWLSQDAGWGVGCGGIQYQGPYTIDLCDSDRPRGCALP